MLHQLAILCDFRGNLSAFIDAGLSMLVALQEEQLGVMERIYQRQKSGVRRAQVPVVAVHKCPLSHCA
jgi:hypothetical protein